MKQGSVWEKGGLLKGGGGGVREQDLQKKRILKRLAGRYNQGYHTHQDSPEKGKEGFIQEKKSTRVASNSW